MFRHDCTKEDLIVILQTMALEMGRTPTAKEFIRENGYGHAFVSHFGGKYNNLLAAAGLKSNKDRSDFRANLGTLRKELTELATADRSAKTVQHILRKAPHCRATYYKYFHGPDNVLAFINQVRVSAGLSALQTKTEKPKTVTAASPWNRRYPVVKKGVPVTVRWIRRYA